MKLSLIFVFIISISAANAYSENSPNFSGRMTVCKKTIITHNDDSPTVIPYYSGSYEGRQEKQVITVHYDPSDSAKKDYIAICGTYGEIAEYTFVNGVRDGSYSHYFHVRGGNCEETTTTTGSYKNDQKDGTWVKEDILDCGGLLALREWGRELNGSHDQMTYTVYNDGKIVAGPASYYKDTDYK